MKKILGLLLLVIILTHVSSGRSSHTHASPGNLTHNENLARKMAAHKYHWRGSEWSALCDLWMGESGFRINATNPKSGAYGIPQSLPANKMASAGSNWQTSARTQIKWGLKYIKDVYGDPVTAYRDWLSRNPHWY